MRGTGGNEWGVYSNLLSDERKAMRFQECQVHAFTEKQQRVLERSFIDRKSVV